MAASIRVGTVTTGEPGSQAAVTNSGTDQDAVFDFVIPQGKDGTSGIPQVLAATDAPPQPTQANTAVSFRTNWLVSGTAITHATNSPSIVINQPGVYLVSYNGTMALGSGTNSPGTVSITLKQDNTTVPGGAVTDTLTISGANATSSFTVPVRVTNAPSTLQMVADKAGFLVGNISITVSRLGDNTAS